MSKLKAFFTRLLYTPVAILQEANLKEMYIAEVQSKKTLEGLLIECDRQRDELLKQNGILEGIVTEYQRKLRILNKQLKGKEE